MTTFDDAAEASAFRELIEPRPIAEYHEDMGPVLWWCWEPPKPFEQISERVVSSAHNGRWSGEPPYVGSPNCLGFAVQVIASGNENPSRPYYVGGWPGYHTHFTPLPPMPKVPK
jgi:hypothetical protein